MTAPHPATLELEASGHPVLGCGCFCIAAGLAVAVVLFFLVPAFVLPWRFWFA